MEINTKLCDVKKLEVESNLKDLSKLIAKPKFVCAKCARASRYKKYLCKPVKLHKKD